VTFGPRNPADSRQTDSVPPRDARPRRPNQLPRRDPSYRGIQGELVGPGPPIAASTGLDDLQECRPRSRPAALGADLAPVLVAQAQEILAVGFAPVDAVFLHRLFVLVVIEHGRRRAHLAGTRTRRRTWLTSLDVWCAQQTDEADGHAGADLEFLGDLDCAAQHPSQGPWADQTLMALAGRPWKG
jgi:hypothetical protein